MRLHTDTPSSHKPYASPHCAHTHTPPRTNRPVSSCTVEHSGIHTLVSGRCQPFNVAPCQCMLVIARLRSPTATAAPATEMRQSHGQSPIVCPAHHLDGPGWEEVWLQCGPVRTRQIAWGMTRPGTDAHEPQPDSAQDGPSHGGELAGATRSPIHVGSSAIGTSSSSPAPGPSSTSEECQLGPVQGSQWVGADGGRALSKHTLASPFARHLTRTRPRSASRESKMAA